MPAEKLPTTMRAAVLHGRGDLRIEEISRPEPGPGELLVAVDAAGVCGTDAHEYAHGPVMYPLDAPHPATGHHGPMIIGHEFTGIVAGVGEGVDPSWIDRRMVGVSGYGCGSCPWCRSGRINLCKTSYATVGLNRHGGLAEYCVVPEVSAYDATDAGLAPDVAGLAQPAAIATHALRRGRVAEGERVVIVGCGGIGAFLVAAAVDAGAHVTALDLDEERLDIARALGAHETLQTDRSVPVGDVVLGLVEPADVVFEVTGLNPVLASLVGSRLLGARIVAVGLQDGELPVGFRDLSLREMEIIGTNALVCHIDFPTAVAMLARDGRDWSRVAPMVIGLDDVVVEGLTPLADGTSRRIKTLIDPRSTAARPTEVA